MSQIGSQPKSCPSANRGVTFVTRLLPITILVCGCGDTSRSKPQDGVRERGDTSQSGAAQSAMAGSGGNVGDVVAAGAAGTLGMTEIGGAGARGGSDSTMTPPGGAAAGVSSAGTAGAGGGATARGAGCIDALWSTYLQLSDGSLHEFLYKLDTVLDDATNEPLTGVVSVQDGVGAGCAALADGTVKCWLVSAARLGVGQLGNGSTDAPATGAANFRATPVVMKASAPLSNIRAMARSALSTASCAITDDGKLYCWGDLTWIAGGGNNTQTGAAQLVTVDGASALTGVLDVALGGRQACALRDGTSGNEVWCWGYGAEGELGQGDTDDQPYPVKVAGLTKPSAVAIAAAYELQGPQFADATTCAVVEGGQVRCWGSNAEGAIGANVKGVKFEALTPVVDIDGAPLTGVIALEAGFGSFSALRDDGSLWVWGHEQRPYATSYATDVVAIGYGTDSGLGPFYLTRDGVYHVGKLTAPITCPSAP